jgi:hypothetical protein
MELNAKDLEIGNLITLAKKNSELVIKPEFSHIREFRPK